LLKNKCSFIPTLKFCFLMPQLVEFMTTMEYTIFNYRVKQDLKEHGTNIQSSCLSKRGFVISQHPC
jgi:hypothetical protein